MDESITDRRGDGQDGVLTPGGEYLTRWVSKLVESFPLLDDVA